MDSHKETTKTETEEEMIDFTKSGQQSRHPGVSTSQGLHGNKPGNFFVHQNSTPEEVESLFTEQREQYDNYYEDLIEGNSWKPFYNFGYSPKTNIDEGIHNFISWFLKTVK